LQDTAFDSYFNESLEVESSVSIVTS